MKKTNLILIIISSLILLGLGYGFGLSLGQKEIEKTETPLANLLASKVIGELTTIASGEITAISGRNLTITNEGDSLTILVKENVSISRLVPPEETETPQPIVREEIGFEDIIVGSRVSIACKFKKDESLECGSMTILSAKSIKGGGGSFGE